MVAKKKDWYDTMGLKKGMRTTLNSIFSAVPLKSSVSSVLNQFSPSIAMYNKTHRNFIIIMCTHSVHTYIHVHCTEVMLTRFSDGWHHDRSIRLCDVCADYLQCDSPSRSLALRECFWEWKNVMQFMFVVMIYSFTCAHVCDSCAHCIQYI